MKNTTIILIESHAQVGATHRNSSIVSNSQNHEFVLECGRIIHDKWVPVTKAWSPIWRVAANKLNKQSRTADEGWFSSLGVVRGSRNST
jgi:hypothetical protein